MNDPVFHTQYLEPMHQASQMHFDEYSLFNATPINGAIGAEIKDVDLSQPLTDTFIAELESALLNHLVLVFRDQQLSPQNLTRLGQAFGELHVNPFAKGLKNIPEVMVVHSESNKTQRFAGKWHSDISWGKHPSLGSLLYAKTIPAFGGDTLFSNMYLAYESLPSEIKTLIQGKTAQHSAFANSFGDAEYGSAPEKPISQPVVRTHPVTKKPCLYVNEYFTLGIDGMGESESLTLLTALTQQCSRPDFCCRVSWQPGTLAFWDNRCTQHYATNDYPGQERVMHRVTITGDRPY